LYNLNLDSKQNRKKNLKMMQILYVHAQDLLPQGSITLICPCNYKPAALKNSNPYKTIKTMRTKLRTSLSGTTNAAATKAASCSNSEWHGAAITSKH